MLSRKRKDGEMGLERYLDMNGTGQQLEEVTASIEDVTPEMARELYETMGRNRNPSPRHTNKLLSDMMQDRWYVTNQGLGIDRNGILIDGQHRVLAVIQLGRPVRMLVVRGIDPRAVKAIDETRKRTFSDDLRIDGESEYSALAALSRLSAKATVAGENGLTVSSMKQLDFSRYEMEEWLKGVSEIIDPIRCVHLGTRFNRHLKLSGTAASAFLYLAAAHNDADIAEEWLEGVITGEGLYRNTPAYALKDRCARLAENRPKPSGEEILPYIVKAYNAYLDGDAMGRLEFRFFKNNRGPSEPFPKMRRL